MLSRCFMICVSVVALTGCAVQQAKLVPADWQNPGHRIVGERLSPLLRAVGRDPETCEVFFWETEHLNAGSLGECTFGFTTGLGETHDATLITGVAAHEVAHEALGHAKKRQRIATTARVIFDIAREIPGGWGAVAVLALIPVSMVALTAYSRSQEAEADQEAVEILRAQGDTDPAGTMAYALEVLFAREGAQGGGILGTHPNTTTRLDVLRQIQANEPCTGPSPLERAVEPAVALPKTLRPADVFIVTKPPDPRAAWSERYKKMAATAEAQAKEAETAETPVNTQAAE